ncbi:PDZ domain-containing protein [Kineococcus sp. NUM-3379]
MDAARAPRGELLAGSALALAALVAVTSLLPVPYASLSPGSAFDTLGERDGKPLLRVTGMPTYPTSGSLDMTTVSVAGGPGTDLTVPELLVAWADPDTSVFRREDLYPPQQTEAEAEAEGEAEMTSSQEAAKVAALRELGVEVAQAPTVADPGPAAGSGLRAGDRVTAVGGVPVREAEELRAQVRRAGADAELRLTVERDGRAEEVALRTRAGEDGTPRLGITLSPYDLPVDVDFSLADVIGPSAGMVFALAIVDELTPGSLTGGEHVAGTGSITPDGRVGVIGGLRQKLVGAREAGAEWFLAPAEECAEVRGLVPEGLRLVPVRTLHEARLAVEALAAGRVADLPTCPG